METDPYLGVAVWGMEADTPVEEVEIVEVHTVNELNTDDPDGPEPTDEDQEATTPGLTGWGGGTVFIGGNTTGIHATLGPAGWHDNAASYETRTDALRLAIQAAKELLEMGATNEEIEYQIIRTAQKFDNYIANGIVPEEPVNEGIDT